MDWFKEMSLLEKINTYGESMYDLGIGIGDNEILKEDIKSMLDIIKNDIEKK